MSVNVSFEANGAEIRTLFRHLSGHDLHHIRVTDGAVLGSLHTNVFTTALTFHFSTSHTAPPFLSSKKIEPHRHFVFFEAESFIPRTILPTTF